MKKLFQQALGIDSPWFIKSIEFESEGKRLDIHIDFKRGSTFSDGTDGAACKAYDTVPVPRHHSLPINELRADSLLVDVNGELISIPDQHTLKIPNNGRIILQGTRTNIASLDNDIAVNLK